MLEEAGRSSETTRQRSAAAQPARTLSCETGFGSLGCDGDGRGGGGRPSVHKDVVGTRRCSFRGLGGLASPCLPPASREGPARGPVRR